MAKRIGFLNEKGEIKEEEKVEEEVEIEATDMVNHPPHYTDSPSGIECIQVTRHMNFNLGNAIKYLWRAGKKNKDKTIEDLEKAIFYIKDEVQRLQDTDCTTANV